MSTKEPGRDRPLIVVALGGNAIQTASDDDSVQADFRRTMETAERLVAIASAGWRLLVTHGNGPQVGNHLLRSELGHRHGGLPLLPLEVCVADTQGGMGYMLQQCLANAFASAGLPGVVATVVTQVLVDHDDPAFGHATKPVGETIPAHRVAELRDLGWELVEDRRRGGWRRVVASPDPREVVEAAAIKALLDDGVVVVAAGGGGIPVVQRDDGSLEGVAAVIDKDLASALLATDLKAEALLVLTDVDRVYLDFEMPDRRGLDTVSVTDARSHLEAGQFGEGSMGPKVEALCRFAENAGGLAVLAAIDDALGALEGNAGTRVLA